MFVSISSVDFDQFQQRLTTAQHDVLLDMHIKALDRTVENNSIPTYWRYLELQSDGFSISTISKKTLFLLHAMAPRVVSVRDF